MSVGHGFPDTLPTRLPALSVTDWHGDDMGQIMERYRAHFTGALVAKCHACRTVWAYWDEDDLDDNGDLVCRCDERDN